GLGRLEFGLRRDLTVGQAINLLQPGELRRIHIERRPRLGDLRAGGIEIGARLPDLVLDHVGVDLGEHLAAGDPVVDVDKHAVDASRDFRADVDLVGRPQVTRRRHFDVERAHGHFLSDVLGPITAAARSEVQPDQQDEQPRDPVLGPPPPARALLYAEELVERLRPRVGSGLGGAVAHERSLALAGSGDSCGAQPPARAGVMRAKALARSACAATTALRACSSAFSEVSRLRKSVRPAWYWLRASSAELLAASRASFWIVTRSADFSRSTAAVSTSSSAPRTDSCQA